MITDKGSKSFKVTRKVSERIIRVTLGRYPDLSIENARKKVLEVNCKIANSVNPNHDKSIKRSEISFMNYFMNIWNAIAKNLKNHGSMTRGTTRFCQHWFKRKISVISNHEVRLQHEKIKDNHGLYQANRLLERIRAIYNKDIEWGYNCKNPALNFKKFKETSRDRLIQPDELL
jgi:hypothetical protein